MESLLSRSGRSIHRRRSLVIVVSLATVAFSGLLVLQGNEFEDGNSPPTAMESGRALELVSEELQVTSTNSVTYIFTHESITWSDPEFEGALRSALEGLESVSLEVLEISLPYDSPNDPIHLSQHVSTDGHRAAAFVKFSGAEEDIEEEVEEIKSAVYSEELGVLVTGSLIIDADFDRLLEADERRAEIIGIPL